MDIINILEGEMVVGFLFLEVFIMKFFLVGKYFLYVFVLYLFCLCKC